MNRSRLLMSSIVAALAALSTSARADVVVDFSDCHDVVVCADQLDVAAGDLHVAG